MYNTYLITFNPLMIDPSPQRLLEFIRAHAYTYQYYVHHLGSVYVKSPVDLYKMINTYRDFLAPNVWTVVQVHNPQFSTGGSAPMAFWNWLNSASPPALEGPTS